VGLVAAGYCPADKTANEAPARKVQKATIAMGRNKLAFRGLTGCKGD
jgi:hypothetical protein